MLLCGDEKSNRIVVLTFNLTCAYCRCNTPEDSWSGLYPELKQLKVYLSFWGKVTDKVKSCNKTTTLNRCAFINSNHSIMFNLFDCSQTTPRVNVGMG